MFDREGNRKYLNWPEREAFLQVVEKETDPIQKSFCLTLFYSGCRISEALNLTREQVDLTGQALVFETLKRRKRGQYRSVPIPETLLAELSSLGNAAVSSGRVWTCSRPTAYRWIKSRMAEAGLVGPKASPKGLRHSFAIACITRNIPLTMVKKWLGHAHLETTAIYLEIVGEEEREMARKLWTSGCGI